MEKDWLIRTHFNQILGPVKKEKIKNLISEKTLVEEDEICCGNGYWFKVKERDLVQNYIYGDYIQGFDPIGEAKSVLTSFDKPLSKKFIVIPFLMIFTLSFLTGIHETWAGSDQMDSNKKKSCPTLLL
jgi:hypothetical protein